MTGFGGKKWSPFTLVSPFGVKKWSLDENVGTAPSNLQFQHFIHNSASLFRECSDHFLRGEFSTRISKLFLKKLRFSRGKNLEK